jgi:hypothetical protein
MENQGFLEEKPNEVEKKAWIEPEMGEINVNGGTSGGLYEKYNGVISV